MKSLFTHPRNPSKQRAVLQRATTRVFLEALESRRLLSAGLLDPTFGSGGIVTDQTLPAAAAVAVQADGKVVEVGWILGNFELARFNANGSPDTSFGYQGRLITDLGGADSPFGVAIQADGKILASGLSDGKFAMARYQSNGQLDNAFGTGGIVRTSFGPAETAQSAFAAVRADGKIIVAGGGTGTHANQDILIARYNTNGTPDTAFGIGGEVTYFDPSKTVSGVYGVALQPNGGIMVAGNISFPIPLNNFAGAMRFNADGTADPTTFTGPSWVSKVAVQSDGKIVLQAGSGAGIARDNPDGSADPGFKSSIGGYSPSEGFTINPDGKIVTLSGLFHFDAGGIPSNLERFNADGTVDSSFGNNGAVNAGDARLITAGLNGTTVVAGGLNFVSMFPPPVVTTTAYGLSLARYIGDSSSTTTLEAPYGGTAAVVPGRIEAENFDNGGEGVAYHDTDPANLGGAYRPTEGVDIQSTTDTGGGYNVGWTHAGEYLKYTVNVSGTGPYDFAARLADVGAGGAFHVEVDGVNVTGTLAIPDTGNFQNYTTVTKGGVTLTAGQHVVKIVLDGNSSYGFSGNVNWIQFTPTAIGSTLSGTVYYDTNGNGVRDAGESGVAGRQVFLDLQGLGFFVNGDPITTTDAGGNYSFNALSPHNYIVRLFLPAGATQTQPTPIYGGLYWVPLFGGTSADLKDFGVQGTLSTLVAFNGNNGGTPTDALVSDAAGNLYGTTFYGGANGFGTVFQIAAGNHTLTTLASFADANNGAYPVGGLFLDTAGNLYGTTSAGGDLSLNSGAGDGTVFRVAAGTHALTTLATFNGGNGNYPQSVLVPDSAGNLYGTTSQGGASGLGTVFEIAAGSHLLTDVATFTGSNGSTPQPGVIADAAGNLYGTTYSGGAFGLGTVFQVAAGTHLLTTLVDFNGLGSYPTGGLVADAAGNLYGTTVRSGINNDSGTVFEVAVGTHALTILATFNGANGAGPAGNLILDIAGNLYGMTTHGGANGLGTIFQVAAGTHALTTLLNFNGANGSNPHAGLLADAAGNLYGTTAGGANGSGNVFQLSGSGFVS